MLRISENLVGDNSLSIVFDLNFLSSSILFLHEKGYTNPRKCHGCYYESMSTQAITEQLGSVEEDD